MIAQYGLKEMTGMFATAELKVIAITGGRRSVCPEDYLLYGEEITRYSYALAALRDVCDEITRRSRTGMVVPRIVVCIDDARSLALRSPDGEITRLLGIIASRGPTHGIELM